MNRERRNARVDQRFWSKVDKTNTCWIWAAAVDHKGYGLFHLVTDHGRKMIKPHRYAYESLIGPIPVGSQIDHKCFNRRCVRPDHLRVVTQKQNQEHREGAQRNSQSGVRGVSPSDGKWRAQVKHNRQIYHVGMFDSVEAARAAVIAKRNELYSHNDEDV